MKRSLVFGVLLTTVSFGGAVAAGALNPSFDAGPDTMLCFGDKGGDVVKPLGSICPKGTTEFFVAGQSQVDAIEVAVAGAQDRIAALEATGSSVGSRLSALEGTDDSIAQRVATLEDTSTSIASRLATAEQDIVDLKADGDSPSYGTLTATAVPGTEPDTWGFILEGEGLVPGSAVHIVYQLNDDPWVTDPWSISASPHGVVYHDGTVANFPCGMRLAIYFSGTGDGPETDTDVWSETLTTGPNCS